MEKKVRVRYRIDGDCVEQEPLPKKIQGSVISRLKIMAKMKPEEKRTPQEHGAREEAQERHHRRDQNQRREDRRYSFKDASRVVSMLSNSRAMWNTMIPMTNTAMNTSRRIPSSIMVGAS